MTTHDAVISQLSPADGARVAAAEIEAALARALVGARARTRVEVAALRVFHGPVSTRVPPLEALPLRRPLALRVLGALAPA